MKKKNTVTLEEISNNKVNKDKKDKGYVFKFFKKNVLPVTLVCMVLALILILAGTISTVNFIQNELKCTEMFCGDTLSISAEYLSRIKMLGITLLASIVPYFYMPFLGLLGYMYNELISVGHIINHYGYISGILRYLLPFVLNVLSISIVTALGVYMTKIVTAKFIMNRKGAMNFTTFRLKIYELTKNSKKHEQLSAKNEAKLAKMKDKIKPIEWKAVGIILLVVLALQFASICLANILV